MNKHNISDTSQVGLYGLSYKEDVDDTRESPTLQLLERMQEHLASGIKVFDPNIKNKIVDNQYTDFDEFMKGIRIIVIMVGHSHIKDNMESLNGKIILDTKNTLNLVDTYKI